MTVAHNYYAAALVDELPQHRQIGQPPHNQRVTAIGQRREGRLTLSSSKFADFRSKVL